MGLEDIAELIDAQALRLHTHIHGHQAWILAQFKTFDLQVMFWDADASIACLVAQARVCPDLIEHAPVEDRIFAGHALLQFPAPANGHVHEGVKLHGVLLVRSLTLSLPWSAT